MKPDADWAQAQIRDSLTHKVWFRDFCIADGEEVHITRLERNGAYVNAILSARADSFPFRIWTVRFMNGNNYAIVKYPHEYTADDDFVPIMLLQVKDRRTLMGVNAQSLQEVAEEIVQCLLELREPSLAPFEEVFGEIPEMRPESQSEFAWTKYL